jgi:hypothetical protein
MSKNSIIDAEKIHILTIKTIRGNIDCPVDADIDLVVNYEFDFDLKTALLLKEKMIGIKLQVDIVALNIKKKKLPITGSYTHEMIFRIDNLDEFVEHVNGEEVIDAALGSTLVSIIYSTVRGIIYSRTQGTSLGIVLLPVIAPLKLMGITGLPNTNVAGYEKNEKKAEKKIIKKDSSLK